MNKIHKALIFLLRKESSQIIQLKLANYTLILDLNNYYVKGIFKMTTPETAMLMFLNLHIFRNLSPIFMKFSTNLTACRVLKF